MKRSAFWTSNSEKRDLLRRACEMNKREKEDKGGEEGDSKKSAEQLGKELLRAAEEGDAERE